MLTLSQQLAEAGFYFEPTEVADNVKCFACRVEVHGWNSEDDPIAEHLRANPRDCHHIMLVSMGRNKDPRNPMDPDLVAARLKTYSDLWPHQGKVGWKCSAENMAAAGWCHDPDPDGKDAVKCWYCDCKLHGFTRKDDPRKEHLKRAPKCSFFLLTKDQTPPVMRLTKKATKNTASGSSQNNRLSTVSTFSEAPSFMSLGDDDTQLASHIGHETQVDQGDASSLTNTKSRKTAASRAPRSGARARKASRAGSAEPPSGIFDLPTFDQETHIDDADATKMGNTLVDSTTQSAAAMTRTRAKANTFLEPTPEPADDASNMVSEVMHSALEERARSPSPPPAKRGVKRTSRGDPKPAVPIGNSRTDKSQSTADQQSHAANESTNSAAAPKAASRVTRKKVKATGDTSRMEQTDLMDPTDIHAGTVLDSISPLPRKTKTAAKNNARKAQATPPRAGTKAQSSDAENHTPPGSRSNTAQKPAAIAMSSRIGSPAKGAPTQKSTTTKVPIAASTPERKKHVDTKLEPLIQWTAAEVEAILLPSPVRAANHRDSAEQRLQELGQSLESPEKLMTLEEWIRARGVIAEQRLKASCEAMVANFENEGARALKVIQSIQVKV